ncbi:hypothetical protein EAG_15728 [Camponotus floridanus]|uniref:Uncharacterized protein n=1 Tax=Camponotus floridanus TaxID=104421 RepID=E2AXB9_CAMFO|nr:hypothetical protein EAG_15728 [Camponotus floridanus]
MASRLPGWLISWLVGRLLSSRHLIFAEDWPIGRSNDRRMPIDRISCLKDAYLCTNDIIFVIATYKTRDKVLKIVKDMYDAVGIRRSCRRLALAASWQNTILRSADLLLLFARYIRPTRAPFLPLIFVLFLPAHETPREIITNQAMRHGKTLRYYHRNYSTPVTPDETSNALNRAIWGQQQKLKSRSISQTSPRRKLNSTLPSPHVTSSDLRASYSHFDRRFSFGTRRDLAWPPGAIGSLWIKPSIIHDRRSNACGILLQQIILACILRSMNIEFSMNIKFRGALDSCKTAASESTSVGLVSKNNQLGVDYFSNMGHASESTEEEPREEKRLILRRFEFSMHAFGSLGRFRGNVVGNSVNHLNSHLKLKNLLSELSDWDLSPARRYSIKEEVRLFIMKRIYCRNSKCSILVKNIKLKQKFGLLQELTSLHIRRM